MSSTGTSTGPSAVVTIAALYGTGGRVIGPERAGVTVEAVASADEHSRPRADRLISRLARVPQSR